MHLTYINERSGDALDTHAAKDTGLVRARLLDLLALLRVQDYDFLAPTPASHARVVARPDRRVGETIEDLLGWSLACRQDGLEEPVKLLDTAGLIERYSDGLVKARVRVSRVFGNLFVHSSFPTEAQDSVFLGPDSHRFADFILRNMAELPPAPRILDYGAGAGVGGITAATQHDRALLTLADINAKALSLAAINATHARVTHDTVIASTPAEVEGSFDLIVMHPPFMIDPDQRAYRDGGDLYGGRLSLDWALAGMTKLAPGGRLVMHTGVSIVRGRDVVFDALHEVMPSLSYSYDYRLLDPDIFGDELDKEPYADVDRIAAIGLCILRDPAPAGANG